MKGVLKAVTGTAAAYMLAIMPGGKNRAEKMPDVFYAHRGLHNNQSDCPENTLAAFRKAVEAGYGIEMDIQLTRDRKVVVAHDMDLKRVAGIERAVDSFTYEELKKIPLFDSEETIPLLTDVLKLVDGKVPLVVELKFRHGSRICEKADKILREYEGVYCIESFHPQVLWWYKKNHPEVYRGQLSMNYKKVEGWDNLLHFALEHLLFNFLTKPDFIAYDKNSPRALSKEICRKIWGSQTFAWTIKSQEELDAAKPYFDRFIFEGFIPEK